MKKNSLQSYKVQYRLKTELKTTNQIPISPLRMSSLVVVHCSKNASKLKAIPESPPDLGILGLWISGMPKIWKRMPVRDNTRVRAIQCRTTKLYKVSQKKKNDWYCVYPSKSSKYAIWFNLLRSKRIYSSFSVSYSISKNQKKLSHCYSSKYAIKLIRALKSHLFLLFGFLFHAGR